MRKRAIVEFDRGVGGVLGHVSFPPFSGHPG